MEPSKEFVFKYKGFYFGVNTSVEHVASLENFEIKDSDIFIATYPKSGTVWTQNILSLILHEGHRNGTEDMELMDRIPWLEYNIKNIDFTSLPVPRAFATHLPYYLLPRDLRNKKGRIIYVTRNPKDVLVSYYHFSKFIITLEEVPDFNIFMERFLAGKVLASSWFDHVAGWYGHAEDFNILFLTYEDMKKDLRSAVLKICNFLGKKLSEEEIESVVRQATFENMKKDPRANYENLPDDIADKNKGRFLRKGTVGDWKNMMTVAQSERFDEVLNEKIKTLPIKITWDMNSETPSPEYLSILSIEIAHKL
uniref:Sulfotransferase n=1 Tax=Anas platyrhynchos TaxID=8839 RepID=A0A8B9ZH80_ANAPL